MSYHYASDSSGRAPYWTNAAPAYPFTSFELGGLDEGTDLPTLAEWESGGVWAWVPREPVAELLNSHGGVIAWEAEQEIDA